MIQHNDSVYVIGLEKEIGMGTAECIVLNHPDKIAVRFDVRKFTEKGIQYMSKKPILNKHGVTSVIFLLSPSEITTVAEYKKMEIKDGCNPKSRQEKI